MSTLSKRTSRLNHPKELKLRLAKAACDPGVSVAQLALEHGINANLLFKWRRHYLAGEFEASTAPAMLPVTVIEESIGSSAAPSNPVPSSATPPPVTRASESKIEVQFADALVRIDSGADIALLSTVLSVLRS